MCRLAETRTTSVAGLVGSRVEHRATRFRGRYGPFMDRRWSGLLIVVLVLLVVAVAPDLSTKIVAGTAVTGPVPGPPAIGDCLTQAPSNVSTENTGADGSVSMSYEHLVTKPCSGSRFGEVVGVLPAGLTMKGQSHTNPDGSGWSTDPVANACGAAAQEFAGQSALDEADYRGGKWQPTAYYSSVASKPDPLQLAYGQQWLACIGYFSGMDGTAAAYTGSARDVFVSNTLPAGAARCAAAVTSNGAYVNVSCAEPHVMELFGSALAETGQTTQQKLDTGCLALVHRFTGMPDPTAAGTLKVVASAIHMSGDSQLPGLSPAGDDSGGATCTVEAVGHRRLTATLLQLGTRSVPWA